MKNRMCFLLTIVLVINYVGAVGQTNNNNQNQNQNKNQNQNNNTNRNQNRNQAQNANQYNSRTAAYIAAGDTTRQMTSNNSYSDLYMSDKDLDAFINNPELRLSDMRQPKNSTRTDDWEYMNATGDVSDYTVVMMVNNKPVSFTNKGSRLSEENMQQLRANRGNMSGIAFTNINVKDRKTGKMSRVPDLYLQRQPDVRVVYDIVQMPKTIYTGYGNTMRVAVTGSMYTNDITYEGDGVTVRPNPANGDVTVTANTPGTKRIYVKNRGEVIDTIVLEAVPLPEPRVMMNDYNNNSMVTVQQLINSNARVHSDAMYPDVSRGYNVNTYTVKVTSRKGKTKTFKVNGSKLNDEVTDYLVDNSDKIEKVEITDIMVDGKNGNAKPQSVVYYIRK